MVVFTNRIEEEEEKNVVRNKKIYDENQISMKTRSESIIDILMSSIT